MYIQFTKDINKIKSSIVLGLGLREIIIALATMAAAFGEYFLFKKIIPTDIVYYLLVPMILIGMFFMVFKHNGMHFEKFIFYKVKRLIFSAKIKRYETENVIKEVQAEYGVQKKKAYKSEKN